VSIAALLYRPASQAAPTAPSFDKAGVSFLQMNCVACHNAKKKKAGVSFDSIKTSADLIKNRKVVEKVLRVLRAGEMPPKGKPRPSVADLEAFVASVQGTLAHHDLTAPPDPGRVTIRRLNRTEYNNTIRDLVGVDFNPAEDFPSDDVGHGFDNIGDVLTLPPVLLERYLAAAESIMERAIAVNPPKPPDRWMSSTYLEPAQPKQFKFRPLDKRGNMLHTPYKLGMEGEYVWRARVWAKLTDKEPVKVAVLNGTKELKRFEVTAAEKTPTEIEVKTTLTAGEHRFFVKLLNPSGERNLHVQWFHLRGPSDTRPLTHRKLLATTGKTEVEKTREVLGRFASRAYRRPATKEEIDRLVAFTEKARKRGDSWEASMQLSMQAVLVSPKFLFRPETDNRPVKGDKPVPLDEYQLASRLSYFLWSSMPDDELLALAGKKQLRANLDAQVKRMLKDAKSQALTENFALQWLQLRRLKTHTPDPKLFPKFDEALRSAMLKETELFFDAIVKEDRSVLELIDAKFTFINDRLSWHYGITDTNGSTWGKKAKVPGKPISGRQFVRVSLQDGDPRGGLLTQASVLTVTSNPTRTSPVKRGRWVLEQILGTPPPPPPPDVPELDEKKVLTGSLRQQMEQHRKNPTCAACHAKMDPLGFAFENFDAVGAYRGKEGKTPIDASGELPDGKKFKGPAELKAILKAKKDLVARNLAEKLLVYALGRGLEHYDRRAVDAIVAAMAKNEYRFSTLVAEITKSLPFTHRRPLEPAR
jgi:mono/diheme cytochrome c family protein